jgi:hypothetical protein
VADDIEIGRVPVLADPPARKRGHGVGKPEGAAKVFARQHPNQWVLARLRHGRRRGSGMLDSADEWQVAIRWLHGVQFGVEAEVVTATYIKFVGKEARRG